MANPTTTVLLVRTWGELKRAVEAIGATDDTPITYMDFGGDDYVEVALARDDSLGGELALSATFGIANGPL